MRKLLLLILLSSALLAQPEWKTNYNKTYTVEAIGSDINCEEVPLSLTISDNKLYITIEVAENTNPIKANSENEFNINYSILAITTNYKSFGICNVFKIGDIIVVSIPIKEYDKEILLNHNCEISIGNLNIDTENNYE